jgi:GTP-binding protein EngB required for normal cell division
MLLTYCLQLILLKLICASKIYVLFGKSQAGKSSFINTLAGQKLAEMGCGSGLSETRSCKDYLITSSPFFPDTNIRLLDVPGLNDNRHNTPDEELLDMIREKVFLMMQANVLESGEARTTIDGIIIFENLEDSATHLVRTLDMAKFLFGDNLKASSMVLFSKYDIALITGRVGDVALAEKDTWGCCNWQREPTNEMVNVFKQILSQLTPYEVSGMQQVIETIHINAQHKYDTQIVKKIPITVPKTRQVKTGLQRDVEKSRQVRFSEPQTQIHKYFESVAPVTTGTRDETIIKGDSHVVSCSPTSVTIDIKVIRRLPETERRVTGLPRFCSSSMKKYRPRLEEIVRRTYFTNDSTGGTPKWASIDSFNSNGTRVTVAITPQYPLPPLTGYRTEYYKEKEDIYKDETTNETEFVDGEKRPVDDFKEDAEKEMLRSIRKRLQ